jgi:cytidylate kinase
VKVVFGGRAHRKIFLLKRVEVRVNRKMEDVV